MSENNEWDSFLSKKSEYLDEKYRGNYKKKIGIKFALFIAFAFLVYLARPFFHDLFYSIRYNPTFLAVGLIMIPTFFALWFTPNIAKSVDVDPNEYPLFGAVTSIGIKIGAFLVLALVSSIIFGLGILIAPALFLCIIITAIYVAIKYNVGSLDAGNMKLAIGSLFILTILTSVIFIVGVSSAVEQREMANDVMDDSEAVEEFPSVNEENPRIVPREVDNVQATGSVSYRQHQLGTNDIARGENGELMWSYPIEPEGFRNTIFENQRGIVISDMTEMEDRMLDTHDETEFDVGEGMIFWRSSDWNLKKTEYWSEYNDDSIDFIHDGEPKMAYSKTGHEWRVELLWGFLPVPYTVPVWDGVAIVHADGDIDHLEPEEARESEVLEGQRLYPFDVTEQYMDSLRYREGIINQMPVIGAHEGQIGQSEMPSGAGNSQLFLIDLEDERFTYIMAMEPYGEDTAGLDEVWFIDSRTGEYTYFETGSYTLLGPDRATGIVRSEDTRTEWGSQFEVVEPVPTVIDGDLWWHTKVVPTDNIDVARNVFVDTRGGNAVETDMTEDVVEFIAGEIGSENLSEVDEIDVEEPTEEDESEESEGDSDVSSDTAYIITVTDDDGNVIDEIEVSEDEEVNIEAAFEE